MTNMTRDMAKRLSLHPAGTLSVMKAAAKAGTVKRVVITSSVAALHGFGQEPAVYTPDSWNTHSTLETQPYPFSKVYHAEVTGFVNAVSSSRKLGYTQEPSIIYNIITINFAGCL